MRGEESVERPCCDDDKSMEVEDNISSDATTEENDNQEENDLTVNESQQEAATTSFNGSKVIISKPEFWQMTFKSLASCGVSHVEEQGYTLQ